MIHVRQHIPAYVTGIEPMEADVPGLSELISLNFIQLWADQRLKRFSICHEGQTLPCRYCSSTMQFVNGAWECASDLPAVSRR